MNLTPNLIVYISHFLIGIVISVPESIENTSKPCGCELQRILGLEPSPRHLSKPRYSNPFSSSRSSARYDELTPEEREERVNRGFARIMQFMTFLGHVDNYLTDKASGLIKIMGRAMETGDEEELQDDIYNRISRRQTQPKISTTITT